MEPTSCFFWKDFSHTTEIKQTPLFKHKAKLQQPLKKPRKGKGKVVEEKW